MVGAAVWQELDAQYELSYLCAGPLIVAGLAVLLVSLLRAECRAMHARDTAEAGLRELNASLEQSVAERTAEPLQGVEGLERFKRSVTNDLRGPLPGMAGVVQLARYLARVQQTLAALGPQVDRL